jgi:hypothetical protein
MEEYIFVCTTWTHVIMDACSLCAPTKWGTTIGLGWRSISIHTTKRGIEWKGRSLRTRCPLVYNFIELSKNGRVAWQMLRGWTQVVQTIR